MCVRKGIFRITPKILKMGFGGEKGRSGKRKWKVQATILTMNEQGLYRREFKLINNTKRKRKRGGGCI